MASHAVKHEYLCEYVHGMGHELFLILARSKEEIRERYPLFGVYGLDEPINVPPSGIERLRMYPGPGRPRDLAVQQKSLEERERFLRAQQDLWEEAARQGAALGYPATTVEELAEGQRWVDIDDDVDFQLRMHNRWKDDMRYRELPPERRLF